MHLIAAHDGPSHAAEFPLLPQHHGLLTMPSAAFTPAEFSDGTAPDEDWRRLGIAISRVKLDRTPTSLSRIAIQGVHRGAIGDDAEWTDDNATTASPHVTKSIVLTVQAFTKQWKLLA